MSRIVKICGLVGMLVILVSGLVLVPVAAAKTKQPSKGDTKKHLPHIGTVTSIDANSITFSAGAKSVVATTTASTHYFSSDKKAIERSTIKAGNLILVMGKETADGKTIEASAVYIHDVKKHGWVSGTIASIDGSVITVNVHRVKVTRDQNNKKTRTSTDVQIKITVAADAKITLDGKPAKLSDLKAGERVTATGEITADGTILAHKVAAGTPHPPKKKTPTTKGNTN